MTTTSADRGLQVQDDVVLELKPNGEGLWRAGNDEVPFSWCINSARIARRHEDGFQKGSLSFVLRCRVPEGPVQCNA